MADQEFLASFGVDIDENGVSRLQKILTENQTLAQSLSESFDTASENVKLFKKTISTELPSLFGGYGNVTERLFGSSGGLKIGLDMTEPKKEIAAFTAEAKKEIPLSANASGIVSAARTALENVRSMFSETFTINVRANASVDYELGAGGGRRGRGVYHSGEEGEPGPAAAAAAAGGTEPRSQGKFDRRSRKRGNSCVIRRSAIREHDPEQSERQRTGDDQRERIGQ